MLRVLIDPATSSVLVFVFVVLMLEATERVSPTVREVAAATAELNVAESFTKSVL